MLTSGPVLVFGASGFLGPHVLRCLQRAGVSALACSRRELPAQLAFGAEFSACDGVQSASGLDQISLVPKAVFYLSAVSSMEEAATNTRLAWRLNAEWPAELARACEAAGVPFVYTSTDLVFGANPPAAGAGAGYTEGDVPSPIGAYGESKRDGERMVLEAYPQALVLRLPLLFGDSFGRGLGAGDGLLAAVRAASAGAHSMRASLSSSDKPVPTSAAAPDLVPQKPMLFTDELRCPMDAKDAARALVLFGGCGGGLPEAANSRLSDIEGRAGILHAAGAARLTRAELGLQLLTRAGLSKQEARAAVRFGTHADAGQEGKRAKDASLDGSAVGRLLAGGGLQLEEDPLEPGKVG